MIRFCKIDSNNIWKVVGLSVNDEQKCFVAKALYSSVGFSENGETDGEEIVTVLKL